MGFIFSLALAMTSCIAIVSAQDISSYDIQMYIEYNKVLVESDIYFDYPTTVNFSIALPYDARKIVNSVDGFTYPAMLDENLLLFSVKNATHLTYSYITNELLDGNSLVSSVTVPFDTDLLDIKVNLPEGSVLGKPLRKGAVQGRSVYPASANLETDGRSISASWEFEDVKDEDEIALYVSYKKPLRYVFPTVLIIAALILISGSLVFLLRRRKKERKPSHVTPADVKPGIENHLKEDEEQVVNLLKLKEGRCDQGTLRVATGFSKAKLSMLLKELEERKIIHKEKSGKKNLVYLKT
jgi:uncharacterized membrane protein